MQRVWLSDEAEKALLEWRDAVEQLSALEDAVTRLQDEYDEANRKYDEANHKLADANDAARTQRHAFQTLIEREWTK